MLLFSFACPNEKPNEKRKGQSCRGHYFLPLRICINGITNSLDLRTDFYEKNSTIFSKKVNIYRSIRAPLSSFPQDFFADATEKKG